MCIATKQLALDLFGKDVVEVFQPEIRISSKEFAFEGEEVVLVLDVRGITLRKSYDTLKPTVRVGVTACSKTGKDLRANFIKDDFDNAFLNDS